MQFTELGLTCKFTPFQNLILVTKLKDSSPVENADVEIRSKENKVLFHGKTDAQGLLMTPGWYKMNFKTWDNFYVMVEKDNDLIYAKNTMLSGINPFQCMTAFNLTDDFYGYYDVFKFSKYYKDYWDYYESDNNGGISSKAYPPNYHVFVFTYLCFIVW